jgi:DNA-directed RNA polymerase specialized sigma24 family protein
LREAYSLRHVSGLTLKQIAAELGLTVPAVKTRLFRAQARMRWFLQPVRATRREAA